MVILENAEGTGSTLLDNAGAYYPEHILLNKHYLQSMPCLKILAKRSFSDKDWYQLLCSYC